MGSRLSFCLVSLGACLAFGGCGKSEGAGSTPRADFSVRAAKVFCESLGSCCGASNLSFDLASCKTEAAATFEENWAEFTDNVDYDENAAGDCLAQLSDSIECGEVEEDMPACERVFVGKVAPGGLCSSSVECRRSSGQRVSCSYEGDGEEGRCVASSSQPARHGAVGDGCNSTCDDDDCGGSVGAPVPEPGGGNAVPDPATCYTSDGVHCDYRTATPTCQPLAALGEACDGYDSCRAGAFCNQTTLVCTAPQANGAECYSSKDCQNESCQFQDGAQSGTCSAFTLEADDCVDPDFD
jgi:hypothetical protein